MTFYEVHLSSFLLNYTLKLNDVVLQKERKRESLTETFKVNEWIFEGINVLSLSILDIEDNIPPGSKISVSLYKLIEGQSNKVMLAEYLLDNGDEVLSDQNQEFFIKKLPFNNVKYNELKLIELDSELMAEFFTTFNKYYNAVKEKDIEEVMSYHKYRAQEYENRYFEDHNTRYSKLKKALEYSFKNEFMLLRPPHCEKLNLHLFGHLITVDYADYDFPLITFTNKLATSTTSYPTYWALNENDEFVIYR
jgi:anaerobic selenocysteine-containing dehydrogenase